MLKALTGKASAVLFSKSSTVIDTRVFVNLFPSSVILVHLPSLLHGTYKALVKQVLETRNIEIFQISCELK